MYTDSDICRLKAKAVQVRANILDMIPPGKVGHLGGSMSIADVVAALYFHHMRVFDDPKNPLQQGSCGAGTVCLPCGTGLFQPR